MVEQDARLGRVRYIAKRAVLWVILGLGALIGAPQVAAASSAYTVSSFTAQGLDNAIPGEPSVAAGPTYIVETTNTEMTVYTKSGTQMTHNEFSSFFSGANTPFCADPVTVYSKAVNRYAIVCTDISANATTRFAVSKTGNPNGGWYKWSTGANTAVDQPSIEFTHDKLLVIGSGPFNCSVCGTAVWAYQLSDILAGKASPRVKSFIVPRGQYRAAVQISSAGTGYLVQGFPSDDVYLGRVTGTPAAGNVAFTETDLGADAVTPPHEPSIPGGFLGGGDLDGRVLMVSYEVTAANNRIIEFSQMAACGSLDSLDCNVDGRITVTSTGPTLSYLKTSPTTGFDQTYGAVVPDGNGRPLMGYVRSSPTQSPQAAVMAAGLNRVVRHATPGVSACGTVPTRVHRAPAPLSLRLAPAASSSSCDMRWGDYLGAAQDPTNPQRVWLSGLYQTASGAGGFTTVITSVTVVR